MVADWYTTTPAVNAPSPGLPACGSTPTPIINPPTVTPTPAPAQDLAARALAYNGPSVMPAAFAARYKLGRYWSGYCEAFVALLTGPRGFGSALADYYWHARRGLIRYGAPPRDAIVYWNPYTDFGNYLGWAMP